MFKVITLLLSLTFFLNTNYIYAYSLPLDGQSQIQKLQEFNLEDHDELQDYLDTLGNLLNDSKILLLEKISEHHASSDLKAYILSLQSLKNISEDPKSSLEKKEMAREAFLKKFGPPSQNFWDDVMDFFTSPLGITLSLAVTAGTLWFFRDQIKYLFFGKEESSQPDTPSSPSEDLLEIGDHPVHTTIWDKEGILRLIEVKKFSRILNKEDDGNTVLMWAAANGHHEIVSALTEYEKIESAYLNQQNLKGLTALMLAAQNGYFKSALAILRNKHFNFERPIRLNGKIQNQIAHALYYARKTKKLSLISLLEANLGVFNWSRHLIESVFDHNMIFQFAYKVNKDKETALIWAAKNGHEDLVRRILGEKHVSDVIRNSVDKLNRTAQDWSYVAKKQNIFDLFQKYVSKLDLSRENWTHKIIEKAIEEKNIYNIIRMRDDNNETPLMYAAKKNKISIVKKLISSVYMTPEIMNAQDTKGNTALLLAVFQGHKDIVEMLINNPNMTPEGLNTKNKEKRSALFLAIFFDNPSHENPSATKYEKIASLIINSKKMKPDALNFLRNSEELTALMLAAQRGRLGIVKELLSHKHKKMSLLGLKLKVKIKDKNYTAYDLATLHGRTAIKKLLEEWRPKEY